MFAGLGSVLSRWVRYVVDARQKPQGYGQKLTWQKRGVKIEAGKYYHFTYEWNLEPILKQGLLISKGQTGPYIWVHRDAPFYSGRDFAHPVLFEVDIAGLKRNALEKYLSHIGMHLIAEDIPPSRLKLLYPVTKGGKVWLPKRVKS